VLATQGTPTSFSTNQWDYGLSSVNFQDGKVTSWHVLPSNPLRVRMLPSSPSLRVDYFTVGSTKDEVLATQGTPTSFSTNQWDYGLSSVNFQDGKVTSWHILPSNPLRVRMLYSISPIQSRGYFTVGSTRDDVLAVQGTPTAFTASQWSYGLSSVSFRNGKVASWSVVPGYPLKVIVPVVKR
jgi:outer membrane protein assembly factor BamE (lipoprotein component of BamABCDE complex)